MAEPKSWFDNAAARIVAQANLAPGELAGDRSTGNVYRRTVAGWADLGLGGGGGSSSGVAGNVLTANLNAVVGTRVTKTFLTPIKGVVVNVRGGAAAIDPDEILALVFGAPTDAVADAWLDEAADFQPRSYVKPGDGQVELGFQDSNGTATTVTRVDVIARGTTPDLDVVLEGLS